MIGGLGDDLNWPKGLQERQQLGPGLLGGASVVGVIELGENRIQDE
ncbi:hypothetical protein PSNTI_07250 [Stutzerimonas stutzeri]|nr:hypothetical protein PSNTI_07250 [Stutzerimonas stutzeri]